MPGFLFRNDVQASFGPEVVNRTDIIFQYASGITLFLVREKGAPAKKDAGTVWKLLAGMKFACIKNVRIKKNGPVLSCG